MNDGLPGTEPYIERPDEHADTGDQLFCWMSYERECEGSCTSYDGSYVEDQRKTPCLILNALRSVALSFGIRTNLDKQRTIHEEQRARKEQVDSLPDPPEVR
jgi:hypothetical protein